VDIGVLLTMVTIASPAAGFLAGALELPEVETVLRGIGVLAGLGSKIYDAVVSKNELRSQRFAPPSSDSAPRPFIVPANGDINDFNSVPVFKNAVTLQLGVESQQGGSFGDHQIYATVKRADEDPPRTLSDVFAPTGLPYAVVTPASNGKWNGQVEIGALPPGAYVSYSWKVPRGQQPTDDYIANTAFVGPVFLAVDDASYSIDLEQAVQPGKNVEAWFQLPDANVA
jgi:hypothetical protein